MPSLKLRLLGHSIISFILTFSIISPDFIMKFFTDADKAIFKPGVVFIVYCFSWILLNCNKWFIAAILSLFFTMDLIQFTHICYFGCPIGPMDIGKIFSEWYEIVDTGISYFSTVWFVLPILLFCYGSSIYAVWKLKEYYLKIPYAFILVLLILSIRPYFATKHQADPFSPNRLHHSIINNLASFSYYFFGLNKTDNSNTLYYQPYKILTSKPKAKNIILIMGESCSDRNLSLFGYARKTTPWLDAQKNNQHFVYKHAISSGVSTYVSLSLFFNLVNEPGNLDQITKKTANLFSLAQNNGYKTAWLSAQSEYLSFYAGNRFFDYSISREVATEKFDKDGDFALLDFLKTYPQGEQNFVVLHQRNAHSPYETEYKRNCPECAVYPEVPNNREQNTVNLYDNSMLYNDKFFNKTIEFVKANFTGETYVIFTSDHGESLGQDGIFGHNYLGVNTASVPFFIYGINEDKDLLTEVNNLPSPISHYEISLLIAKLLGFEIHNPNITNSDTFYIHGNNNLSGHYLYMELKRTKDGLKYSSPISTHLYNYVRKAIDSIM